MVITLAPAIAEVAQVDASSGVLSWVENVNGRSSMRPPVNVNSALGIEPAISPKILGVELQGARRRSNTAAKDKRLQTSLQLIRKSTYLPVEWNVKTKVITGAIMGKVTWGWMFRRPPAHMLQMIQNALNRAISVPLGGWPDGATNLVCGLIRVGQYDWSLVQPTWEHEELGQIILRNVPVTRLQIVCSSANLSGDFTSPNFLILGGVKPSFVLNRV